jgi:aminopeptidase YwaD
MNAMSIKKNIYKIGAVIFLLLVNLSTAISQDVNYARKVINTMSSPAFKGRGYAENGDRIASTYIAEEFKNTGLIPLNNGSYFQEFKISVNTFPAKVSLMLNNTLLTTGVDYLVDAASAGVNGTFKVISVKGADLNTSEKLKSLVSSAKDAFILLDNGIPESEAVPDKDKIKLNIEALLSDKELDFKGLIILGDEKLTWTTSNYQYPRPVLQVNSSRFAEKLGVKKIHTITVNIDQHFLPEYTTRNVVGMVKGSSASDSAIVITAHYDHLGLMGKDVYFPGANDNASGVAMLLNLAKYYSINKPVYNVVFLCFSGEEIGLMGSRAFVQNPLVALNKIKFLINFDIVGTGDAGIKVVNGSVFKPQFDMLVSLNDRYRLLPKVDIRGEACNSDHCPFYVNGVSSFFIYTQGGISAYHDIYDRADTLPLTAFNNYFVLMTKFIDLL